MASNVACAMDLTADYPVGKKLGVVPMVYDSSFNTLKYSHKQASSPSSINKMTNDNNTDTQGMSVTFREVFRHYSTNNIENEAKFNALRDNRAERMADAFHKGEKLLLSEDNLRHVNRARTSISLGHKDKHSDSEKLSVARSELKSARSLHTYISDETVRKIFSENNSQPILQEKSDNSNNAKEGAEDFVKHVKKGKKQRKRSFSSVKSKKGKQGKISVPSTNIHYNSDQVSTALASNHHPSKPRVSSEPPSKITLSSVISYTLQGNTHKPSNTSPEHMYSSPTSHITGTVHNNTITPSPPQIPYGANSNQVGNSLFTDNLLQGQSMPLTLVKADVHPRVKSGHSLKSEAKRLNSAKTIETYKDVIPAIATEPLSLTAKPCGLQRPSKNGNTSHVGEDLKLPDSNSKATVNSTSSSSKEEVLVSIYGAVYQTANKLSAKVEELKKLKKIFLSDKQSGSIHENGLEFPCAPPATPTPDMMKKYEYVPSMGDIRSQQAVKKRLQVMEKEASKKREKQREANAKLEKQQMKDREKALKAKQRQEIYALNKIMTELEYKRFLEFCNAKGLRS